MTVTLADRIAEAREAVNGSRLPPSGELARLQLAVMLAILDALTATSSPVSESAKPAQRRTR